MKHEAKFQTTLVITLKKSTAIQASHCTINLLALMLETQTPSEIQITSTTRNPTIKRTTAITLIMMKAIATPGISTIISSSREATLMPIKVTIPITMAIIREEEEAATNKEDEQNIDNNAFTKKHENVNNCKS